MEKNNVYQLKPITSDKDLEKVSKIVDSLISKSYLTKKESNYLNALSLLIENYENKYHPIEPPTVKSMLKHLLEAQQVSEFENLSKKSKIIFRNLVIEKTDQ